MSAYQDLREDFYDITRRFNVIDGKMDTVLATLRSIQETISTKPVPTPAPPPAELSRDVLRGPDRANMQVRIIQPRENVTDQVVKSLTKTYEACGGAGYLVPYVTYMPQELDEDTKQLVNCFASALAVKLMRAKQKYGYTNGWSEGHWREECMQHFHDHIDKGDPIDVAAFAAFMWYHGWKTV